MEAIQDIARRLQMHKLMLCSTDDPFVKSTWQHLGFSFTSDQQMEEWDIPHSDLVYLQNTVQVRWRSVLSKGARALTLEEGPQDANLA